MRPTRLRILLINPNTSATITDILAARMREIAGPGVTILPVTGRFGAPYIASRAAAAIAGHAALDALAEHGLDCDVVYLACFGDPGLAARIQGSVPVQVICSVEAGARAALAARDQGRGARARLTVDSVGLSTALAKLLGGG